MLSHKGDHAVTDRQKNIADSTNVLAKSHVALFGAGGIGSNAGYAFSRIGLGAMSIFDHDTTGITNLNRQFYFTAADIGKPKAWQLIKNLAPHCILPTRMYGYKMRLQDAVALRMGMKRYDAVVIGIDNDIGRVEGAKHFLRLGIPTLLIGLGINGECGYCFLQLSKPGAACFGCKFPRAARNPQGEACDASATIEMPLIVVGTAVRMLSAALSERRIGYNYLEFHLDGVIPDEKLHIEKNPSCPLCGTDVSNGQGLPTNDE